MTVNDFFLAGNQVKPGQTKTMHLSLARLFDYTELKMPVRVMHGRKPGPTFFVSGGIHGDEMIGPAIVRRLLRNKSLKDLSGTLIAVPIVNVFGYNTMSRYLPDRRDLNRCFPGSPDGSLAARIAHIFVEEILKKSDYGIDLHSGSNHRSNLPQIRANLLDEQTRVLAENFGAPVILNSQLRDGSLRAAANDEGVKTLLFEGGEGLRVEERYVRLALKGILRTMEKIGMLTGSRLAKTKPSFKAKSSYWVRAPQSGALRVTKALGSTVKEKARIADIGDAFGDNRVSVRARSEGVVIGMNRLPVVNKGDALFHIATFDDAISEFPDDHSEFINSEGYIDEL